MLRTLAALLLLAAVALVGIRLGNWQLDRASQREAIKTAIDTGRASTPLQLNALTPPKELTPWRAASVNGTWLHQYTVLLDNRSYQGKPGYWIATPLQLSDDKQQTTGLHPANAVLVLRGWLPLPAHPGTIATEIPTPTGIHAIHGELLERVPRLFEVWSWSSQNQAQLPTSLPNPDLSIPVVQNLDLAALAQASGLTLLPTVLAANPDDTSGLHQTWPEPSLDADKNRGYALQWFGFATIAGIAWLVVLWRALKRRQIRRN